MKKQLLLRIIVTVLCILSLITASQPNAVKAFTPFSEELCFYSFFEQIDGTMIGICYLYAGLLSGVCVLAGIFYLITDKRIALQCIFFCSFASATLAGIPIIAQTNPKLLPNMIHPVSMFAVTVIAYTILGRMSKRKKSAEEAPRLPNH